ncbi:hypothetical protein RRF57_010832 [Xylaria bambusicola]|uniref:Uncharacterized protein n=1 Tax=Xylaria bambusicola TaxID=326684 RepID=A0AAN7Z340_9PEZI
MALQDKHKPRLATTILAVAMPSRAIDNLSSRSPPSILLPSPVQHTTNDPQHDQNSGKNWGKYSTPYDDEAAHNSKDSRDKYKRLIRSVKARFANPQDDGPENSEEEEGILSETVECEQGTEVAEEDI